MTKNFILILMGTMMGCTWVESSALVDNIVTDQISEQHAPVLVTLNPDLALYTYPDNAGDAAKLKSQLMGQPVIPQNLICQIMRVGADKVPHPTPQIPDAMMTAFQDHPFNYTGLINIKGGLLLTEADADHFYENMVASCPHLNRLAAFTIDAEPVYAAHYDTTDFHIQLINRINHGLNRPVSMYFSPHRLGNTSDGIIHNAPKSFSRLVTALHTNPNNFILIPAYSDPHPDMFCDPTDIINSATHLDAAQVPFKLCFDTRSDDNTLSTRLDLMRQHSFLRGAGTVVYSLQTDPLLHAHTMQLIGNYAHAVYH